ncbi:hypothetical protein AMELA_G00036540 [Ameiurus melas]|uniref:Uncharacterized protein n=1 Tax=Ameiurus melas TaxID=219545 RepID=A0A7J6B8Y8_AMEME|nr:hypothetical protein AMELA_G00036540 [Ameiurus melas]
MAALLPLIVFVACVCQDAAVHVGHYGDDSSDNSVWSEWAELTSLREGSRQTSCVYEKSSRLGEVRRCRNPLTAKLRTTRCKKLF